MTLPLELRRWKVEAPEAWFHFNERAAIREHCGNQSREEAEREAEVEARRLFSGAKREQCAPIRGRSTRPVLNADR